MSGYYLMHRGWRDNSVFAPEPYTEREAWEWLIEQAAFADRQERLGRQMVDLQRGQVALSIRPLAKAWQWSKSRVQRYLAKLAGVGMVGTVEALDGTILTICNYETYQDPTLSRAGNAGTPAGQRTGRQAGREAGQRTTSSTQAEPRLFDSGTGNAGTAGGTAAGTPRGTELRMKGGKEPNGDSDRLFEQWWSEVPRKVGKGQARTAFRSALGKAPFDTLLAGIRRYQAEREGQEDRYTKHPATWLNGECWADDAPPSGERSSRQPSAALEDIEFERAMQSARRQGPAALKAFLETHRTGGKLAQENVA